MIKSLSLMIFGIIFLIFGTIYIVIPLKNTYAFPFFTLLSIVPAVFSFTYSQNFTYWEYICSMFGLPYIVLFWSIIRVISVFRPLFQNKILAILYLLIHLPMMVFVMDVFNYFQSGNIVGPVGYVAISVILFAIAVAIVLALANLCIDLCEVEK
jgi:hypothetical protein